MFSKACEYGIRAAIYIADQSLLNKKVNLKDLAKAIDSPEAYTSKILQQLIRKHIIFSEKGSTGGFLMDKQKLHKIMLSTIITAIDGDNVYKGCALGLKNCNEKMPCPLHHQFKVVKEQLTKMLETTSIKSLAISMEGGVTFLRY